MSAILGVVRRQRAVNDPSMARKIFIALVVAAALAAAGWLIFSGQIKSIAVAGKQNVEAWCARQLLAIAADHLNPTLHFDALEYKFPKTARLTNVTLMQDNIVVISADAITIEFAGIPAPGTPLVIQKLDLLKPRVRLLVQPDGSLLGLAGLVKSDGGAVSDDGGSTRLSDVLAITVIKLTDGSVSYEPPDQPAMVLQPLTFDLKSKTDKGGTEDSGWYAFEATSTLDPVVELATKARLNLDNGDLDFDTFTLDLTLTSSQYQIFTPNIQQFLSDNEIVGTMTGSMEGRIGLGELARTSLGFHVKLDDARAVIAGYEIPIKTFDLEGSYRQNVLAFPKITAHAFQGNLEVSARFDYGAQGSPFEAQLDGSDLKLEDTMAYEGMPNTEYTGDVTLTVKASGQSDDMPGTLTGGGELSVANGRFVIVQLFDKALKKKAEQKKTDRAEITFELHGDRVHLSKILILGNLVGIKGDGDIYYDGRLNAVVSAGGVERIAAELGPIGQFFGTVAGSVVKYQVTGTLTDTRVAVLPLGIGRKRE